MRVGRAIGIVGAALLAAGVTMGPGPAALGGGNARNVTVLLAITHPQDAPVGGRISFTFFACVFRLGSTLDLGADGVPGGDADDCKPAAARVTARGGVGRLDTQRGPTVVLTITRAGTLTLIAEIPGATFRVTRAVGTGTGSGNGGPPGGGGGGASGLLILALLSGIPMADAVEVERGQSVSLEAWQCPTDAAGLPLTGEDGTPGRGDDDCSQALVHWEAVGTSGTEPVATVEPADGHRSVLRTSAVGGVDVSASFGQGAARRTAARGFAVIEGTGTASGALRFADQAGQEVDTAPVFSNAASGTEQLAGVLQRYEVQVAALAAARDDGATSAAALAELELAVDELEQEIADLVPVRFIRIVRAIPTDGGPPLPNGFLAEVDSLDPLGVVIDSLLLSMVPDPRGFRSVDAVVVVDADEAVFEALVADRRPLPREGFGVLFLRGAIGGWLRAATPTLDIGIVKVEFAF